ncbi:hypothetical protein D3C81_1854470 [compost metagenome]
MPPLLRVNCACWSLPVSPGVEKRRLPSCSSTSVTAPLALTLSAPSGKPSSASGSTITCAGRTGSRTMPSPVLKVHVRPELWKAMLRSMRTVMVSAGVTVDPAPMLPASTSPSMMVLPAGALASTACTLTAASLPLLRMCTR